MALGGAASANQNLLANYLAGNDTARAASATERYAQYGALNDQINTTYGGTPGQTADRILAPEKRLWDQQVATQDTGLQSMMNKMGLTGSGQPFSATGAMTNQKRNQGNTFAGMVENAVNQGYQWNAQGINAQQGVIGAQSALDQYLSNANLNTASALRGVTGDAQQVASGLGQQAQQNTYMGQQRKDASEKEKKNEWQQYALFGGQMLGTIAGAALGNPGAAMGSMAGSLGGSGTQASIGNAAGGGSPWALNASNNAAWNGLW
jgi:hypothetical protein